MIVLLRVLTGLLVYLLLACVLGGRLRSRHVHLAPRLVVDPPPGR